MATHAVRINQRLLLEGSFEWTIECLELPQEQTSASAALTSQIDPSLTSASHAIAKAGGSRPFRGTGSSPTRFNSKQA
jgi:hypothetical protein